MIEILDVSSLNNENATVWYEKIKLEDYNLLKFKLDTGSQVNLIPYALYKQMSLNKKPKSCNIILRAYGGQKIVPLFQVELNACINNKNVDLSFMVIKEKAQPILGLDGCIKLDLIKKVDNIKTELVVNNNKYCNRDVFIQNNPDVFKGLGLFPDSYKIKIDSNVEGIIRPPRRLPQTLSVKLEKELEQLVRNKIIARVKEPEKWSSNIILIEKPDKSLRLCLNPMDLNKAIKRDFHLIPTFEEMRAKLLNKKYYTVLDIKQGFYHIKLDEESSKICTFGTPFGYYRFLRLPFGIKSAPEAFIMLNNKYFGKIDDDNIVIYFDDILIATETLEKHNYLLEKVLETARKYNVKFNEGKVQYKQSQIRFMGHIFNEDGVRPDPERVESITNKKPD